MGCIFSTHAFLADELSSSVDLSKFLVIKKGFSLRFDGFNEYRVFEASRPLNELSLVPEGQDQGLERVTLTKYIRAFVKNGLVRLFNTSWSEGTFDRLARAGTIGESMYLSDALSLSIAQHIVGAPQDYMIYPVSYPFAQKKQGLDQGFLDAWGKDITSGGGDPGSNRVLDINSVDPVVVRALELRFIQNVVRKLTTYNFNNFTTINNNMVVSVENYKNLLKTAQNLV